MNTRAALAALALLVASRASAQTPIIIGPTSQLAWESDAGNVATAQSLTYAATVDGTGAPIVLTGVTCVQAAAPLPASTSTCSCAVSQIPFGSHSVQITSSNGTVTSVPSTAFAYVVLAIPVPKNVRLKP
jgi:hypothetical protein